MDSQQLDITGWRPGEIDDGVSLLTELGRFGPGGRALYDPRPVIRDLTEPGGAAGFGRKT